MFMTQNVTAKAALPQSTEAAVVVNTIEHASMNYLVLWAVFGILGLYCLGFLLIKRIRGKEQVHMGATIIPQRSYYRKPHHYFLLFYTGSGRHAGTTANVYCVIHSKQKKTKPIVLRDPERLLFQSGTITSFLVTLNQSLDQITKIHLWHDISGPQPSWFLERVIICHLNTKVTWCFEGYRWLDVSGGEKVECELDVLPRSRYLKRKPLFDKTFSESFKNKHVWLSPFLLRNRTKFSRYEKLATCLVVTMTTVLIATIVVNSTIESDPFPDSAIKIGPLEFRVGDVLWSVISSIFPFSLRLLLELLFTYSEKRQQLSQDENDVQGYINECLQKANEITILESESNKSSESDDTKGDAISLENEISLPEKLEEDSTRRDCVISSEWHYLTDNDQSPSEISLREVGLEFNDDISLCKSSMDNFHNSKDVINKLESTNNTDNETGESEDVRNTNNSEKTLQKNHNNTNDIDNKVKHMNKKSDVRRNGKLTDNARDKRNLINKLHKNGNFVNGDCAKNRVIDTNQQNEEIFLGNGYCVQEIDTDQEIPEIELHNERPGDKEQHNAGILPGYGHCVQETDKDPELPGIKLHNERPNDKEQLNGSILPGYGHTESGLHNATQPKQDNFAYTNSLRNNDKVSKLWKMLPLPGFLIDPNCVKLHNEENSLKLHRKYFHIAIAVCIVLTMISITVSIRYGLLWTTTTTITWLITIFLALFFQMFVAETLVMLFQSIYFAIVQQRPTEENDVINEQKIKVWCKEEDDVRYYVDDLDDKGSSVPIPPSEEEVKKAREKAGEDRQLEEVLTLVAFDVLFLVQLVIIGFGNRDPECYPMRVVIENNYNIPSFEMINNSVGFWNWTKNHLVAGLYYQGKFKEANSRQTRDGYGTLLGVPILRQHRIVPTGTCDRTKYSIIANIPQCNVAIPAVKDYDKRQLYPGWKTSRPSIDVTSLSPWRYKTGSQSNTDYTAYTRIGSYEPGGYIASLGFNKTSALKMLDELESLNWIDRFTRVVFIEYAVYNGNNNMLSTILISVEFTAFGGAFPSFNHASFRLYRYFTTLQTAYLICEIIFVVFIVQLCYRVLCEIHEQRFTYFTSFWNWTDLVLVLSSLITIGLYGARAVQLQKGISAIEENPEVFFSFYDIGRYDHLVAYMSCIVVLIPMLQFLKFLKFNRSFMIFYKTLKHIMPEIGGFIVIFLISLVAFAFWAFYMLKLELEAYSTFAGSFNSILSMLLAKFSFRVFSPGSTIEYGPLFTYAFTVVNVFFIMTIILCIISLGFTTAKEEELESKYEIVKFIVNRIKDTLGLNPPYIPPKPVIKTVPVDYAYLQLQLNTGYILGSQLTRIARFANTVYSEDTINDFEYIRRILGMHDCVDYLENIIRWRSEARGRQGNRLEIKDVPYEEEMEEDSDEGRLSDGIKRDILSEFFSIKDGHSKSRDFVV